MSMPDSAVDLAQAVLVHGPITRADLSARTGLSLASITRLAGPWLERGLFTEIDELPNGTTGRPAKPLDIRPQAGRFVGIKLTENTIQAALTDLRTTVLDQRIRPLESRDPAAVAQQIAALTEEFGLPSSAKTAHLTGAGICLGAKVDAGTVVQAPFLGWHDVEFGPMVTAATGVPTVLENDVVALTRAEHWFGPVKDLDGFCVITTGIGVGYGLVQGGRVIATADTGLGLAGHIILDPAGPLCDLGHRGCAESYLSFPGLRKRVKEALGIEIGFEQMLAMAMRGQDPQITAIVDDAARALGRLIALAANLTMNNTVLLGGEGIDLWLIAEPTIRAAAAKERNQAARPLRIELADPGFLAWARGAAAVAIQQAIRNLN